MKQLQYRIKQLSVAFLHFNSAKNSTLALLLDYEVTILSIVARLFIYKRTHG